MTCAKKKCCSCSCGSNLRSRPPAPVEAPLPVDPRFPNALGTDRLLLVDTSTPNWEPQAWDPKPKAYNLVTCLAIGLAVASILSILVMK